MRAHARSKKADHRADGLPFCGLAALLEIIELEHLCNTLGHVLRDIDQLVFGAFCFCDGKRTGINALGDVAVCIIGVLVGVEGLAAKNGNHFNQISVRIIDVFAGGYRDVGIGGGLLDQSAACVIFAVDVAVFSESVIITHHALQKRYKFE